MEIRLAARNMAGDVLDNGIAETDVVAGDVSYATLRLGTSSLDGGADGPDGGLPGCTGCVVTALHPPLARAGDLITVEGRFTAPVIVRFPGMVTATPTVIGSDRLQVQVPPGATAGTLTVETMDGGTIGGADFRRLAFMPRFGSFQTVPEQAGVARETPRLPVARMNITTTRVGSRIYAIGGRSDSAVVNEVDWARVDADGSIGNFADAGSPLKSPRSGHVTVLLDKTLYVLGGYTAAGAVKTIERSTVGANDVLGAFDDAPVSMGTGRAEFAALVVGRYLYVFGGNGPNGNYLATVERTEIGPGGTLSAFQDAGVTMNRVRDGLSAAVVGRYVYVSGGISATGYEKTVERALIAGDGSLGAFENVDTLSVPHAFHSSLVLVTSLYVFGGYGGTALGQLSSVEVAAIKNDDSLDPFTPISGVDPSHRAIGLRARGHRQHRLRGGGNRLDDHRIGGTRHLRRRDVDRGPLVDTARAGRGSRKLHQHRPRRWPVRDRRTHQRASQPGHRARPHPARRSARRVRHPAGLARATTCGRCARHGRQQPLRDWRRRRQRSADHHRTGHHQPRQHGGSFSSAGVSLAAARVLPAAVATYSTLYVVGGNNMSAVDVASIEQSTIGALGTLGPFTTATPTLATARSGFVTVAAGDQVHALGGAPMGNERAIINSDGTINSFGATGTLGAVHTGAGAAVVGDRVLIGGGTSLGLETAPLQTTGALGSFTAATSRNVARPVLRIHCTALSCFFLGGNDFSPRVERSPIQ